ncbi:gamma-glutamyltransferase [Thiohalomonas denitrificans]|uniref:Glutathione hydrolase proenzyme n=1 Tax=Thiohalomonas denitrificans TaxID=415747 RepID=A0A1G5PUQ3_9GAMM|nr:gamma-glutamyltransferase [Thiohalomonas denitrificans]SCZ53263.1 gamma-glutamyltranspeptidase / glutathione hydrolase [Thiohalomonas denitrificans]
MARVRFLFVLLVLFVGSVQAGPPKAAIASAHPLATEAGFEVLERGGNAFDAAVAVSAALAVVEPYSSGIGGGGFWLLHRASDDRDVMIDGREVAPLAAHRDMYLDDKGEVVRTRSMDGPLAAGIPGEPAALAHIAGQYGRLPMEMSMGPAIRHAGQGFEVTPHYRRMARFRRDVLREFPAAATFLTDDEVPPLGYRIRQPELARTLTSIAKSEAESFYRGELAAALVADVREAGGIWTLEDLENYRVIERAPIRGRYRGLDVISAAPPSSGGVALVTMLNILSGYDLSGLQPARRTHLIVEAMRRAYRDRAEYLGDPDFVEMPLARLTDPDYAAGLRAAIHPEKATPSAMLPGFTHASTGRDTTHFSILDTDGNYVAATLSINYPFGSGFLSKRTGVLLNDEMDDFSAKPGVPNAYGLVGAEANAIASGKRPLSSMSPTFVRNADRIAVLGTPGGSRIITMVLLGILEFAEGKDPEAWISRPRFHHQYLPDRVFHEPEAFSTTTLQALEEMGHTLEASERTWGNMQGLVWDRRGKRVEAASDPRGEGAAVAR